jgi:hypothetical protein
MDGESTGHEVFDFEAYRRGRQDKDNEKGSEVLTDVRFCMTRSGKVLAFSPRIDELHSLTVLAWCLELASKALDKYLH